MWLPKGPGAPPAELEILKGGGRMTGGEVAVAAGMRAANTLQPAQDPFQARPQPLTLVLCTFCTAAAGRTMAGGSHHTTTAA